MGGNDNLSGVRILEHNFYPMRPAATGRAPTRALLAKLRATHVIQPKLNGDRVCLWVERDDSTYAQHRKGGAYSFMIRNRGQFAKLPAGTVLDGEVFGGKFYPFEVLRFGDLDLRTNGPEARALLAERVCRWLGEEWLFAEPTLAQLDQMATDFPATRQWEGVVCKRRGSAYRPHAKPTHESPDWFKLKWC